MKKKLLTSLLIGTILSTSFLGMTPVLADEFDTQIEEAQRDASQHEQATNSLDALINQLTNEVTNTQAALTNLNTNIQKNETFLKEAITELEKAHQEMNELQDQITVLEENIEKRSVKLEEQARQIQVNGSSSTYFEYILNSESLTDVMARIDVVTKVVDSSNSMIEDQLKDKEAVSQKTEETDRKIVQQNALAEKLEETSEELGAQKASQEALVVQLQIEQSTVSSDREALVVQRNAALERVDSIQNEREQVRAAAEQAEQQRQNEQARVEAEEQTEEAVNVSIASSNRESARESSTTESTTSQQSETNTNSNNHSDNSSNNDSNNNQSTNEPAPTPAPVAEPVPVVKPAPKPEKPAPVQKPAPSGNVLSIANQYIGTPYLYGGSTTRAFDCSGFTRHVFAQAGKKIPRNSGAQYAQSQKVSNPQPGDLVFFGTGSVTHVGIYQGGGRFIGSQTSTGVAGASLTSGYWSNKVIGYGRY